MAVRQFILTFWVVNLATQIEWRRPSEGFWNQPEQVEPTNLQRAYKNLHFDFQIRWSSYRKTSRPTEEKFTLEVYLVEMIMGL